MLEPVGDELTRWVEANVELNPPALPYISNVTGEIAGAELAANQIVWEDRPVQVRFVDASEAADLPLRKDPARTGVLRIVEVEGYDLSACGGTHVLRTGAIGSIVISSSERFRGGTRVEFLCGTRALQGFRGMRDSMDAAARLLSTGGPDLPGAIERLLSENKAARRHLKDMQERLARHEAGALAASGIATSAGSIVLAALDGWDAGALKSIASAIAERPGHAAVLASGPQPLSIVVARAADVTIDAGAIIKALTARFGGRGGGKPELAQGGGLNAAAEEVIAFARTLF
jgi:alanyl-tRNA synthetase